ncbi:MAG: phosphotransferase, partial [Lachnospiraceae bacterium]|nr:phosphotransferase [Lachnospiraceae bacterium]
LLEKPQAISGGLMHKMYHVTTTQGEYAIKALNPDIMKRPEALQNMINSELVSNALKGCVPLVAAKEFQGKHIWELEGAYFMVFDWLEGRSVFAPDITTSHCEQIGKLLGQIHTANVRVESLQKLLQGRETCDWSGLLARAEQENAECYVLLKAHLEEVARWDRQVVEGWQSMAQKQVISHRDLDPKNVMWKEAQPFIIDWEAAGYVNPFQELVEVLNYWIVDEQGQYNEEKFAALVQAYRESMDIRGVDWAVVLSSSFDGMLGWLEYNVKRAVGIEGSSEKDRQEGLQQVAGTLQELKRYEAQLETLRDWIAAYTSV